MSGLAKTFVDLKIHTRRIMVFAKSNDPDSLQVKRIFEQYYLPPGIYSPFKRTYLLVLCRVLRMARD